MTPGIARVHRAIAVVYVGALALSFVALLVFLGAFPLNRGTAPPECLWGALGPGWAEAACLPNGHALTFLGASGFATVCAHACLRIVGDILAPPGQKKYV